jgi:surface polysaccharide O-acyltransferase-like enzyme
LNEDIKKQLLLIYSNKKEKILDGLEYLKKNLPINDEVNYKTNFHVIGKLMNNINELEKLKLNEKIFKLGEIIKEYEIILGKINLRNKKISISYNN